MFGGFPTALPRIGGGEFDQVLSHVSEAVDTLILIAMPAFSNDPSCTCFTKEPGSQLSSVNPKSGVYWK